MSVLRACYTFRHDGINWPINNKGLPSFKLEDITAANTIEHTNSHNAMSDVFSTIKIAKLIKQTQPKLFNFFFQLRKKNKINKLININIMKPLVYVSNIFGSIRSNTSLISPLAWHPRNKNVIIVCDLAEDISPLLKLDIDTLTKHLFSLKSELVYKLTIPIKLIHINKCPILAPINTLRSEDVQHISLDLNICQNNLSLLRQHSEIKDKVIQIFNKPYQFISEKTDVDDKLYSSFFSKKDFLTMAIIRQTLPENLHTLNLKFDDPRMNQLFFRYRARNYSSILTEKENRIWLDYRRSVLTKDKITKYLQTINQLFIENQKDKYKCQQLKSLVDYLNQIYK